MRYFHAGRFKTCDILLTNFLSSQNPTSPLSPGHRCHILKTVPLKSVIFSVQSL